MILSSLKKPIAAFGREQLDLLIYGLGYEVRSTALAAQCDATIFAIRMEGPTVHAAVKNARFAKTAKHLPFSEDLIDLKNAIVTKLHRSEGLHIGFDISSVNRAILFDIIVFLATCLRSTDRLTCFYVPAEFKKPDLRFPQIESFEPSSNFLSGFLSDPTLPLCLVLGAGYEHGVSMGIVNQLEPRRTFCFWGGGVDERFDRLVQESNSGFQFPTFDVQVVRYPLHNPWSAYEMLESLTFGMLADHRVIIAPMGPKIFSLLAALSAMEHFGMVAVWRVKHSLMEPRQATPNGEYIRVEVDCNMLMNFGAHQQKLLEAA